MRGFVRGLALVVALFVAGAPSLIAEVLADDCADECATDEGGPECPVQGCDDCSVLCSSFARTHVVAPAAHSWSGGIQDVFLLIETGAPERLPPGPVPQGIFHPPRAS